MRKSPKKHSLDTNPQNPQDLPEVFVPLFPNDKFVWQLQAEEQNESCE